MKKLKEYEFLPNKKTKMVLNYVGLRFNCPVCSAGIIAFKKLKEPHEVQPSFFCERCNTKFVVQLDIRYESMEVKE